MTLDRLAIFPLPRAMLFPHAVLPLHVFEPRYRRMLADCLAADRTMAIAYLDEASNVPGKVRPLVGVGSIVAHETLPDGRSNMLLRGLGRARIDEELPVDADRPYRIVRATWAEDLPVENHVEMLQRQSLIALATALAERLPEGGDTLRALVGTQAHAGGLSDLLAAALVVDSNERLRIFETLDVAARCEGVHEAIAAALMSLGESESAPN